MVLGLSPQSLARRCSRRPKLTIGVWALVLLVAIALTVTLMGDALTTDVGPTGAPESEEAWQLIGERFYVPGESQRDEVVLVRSRDRTVDDPAFKAYVEDLFADILALGPITQGVNYYQTGYEFLVSLDRHTTALAFTFLPRNREDWVQYWEVFDQRDQNQWRIPADPLHPDRDRGEFSVHSFEAGGSGGEVVILRSPDFTVDDAEYRQFVEDLFYNMVALGRNVVWSGAYYYATVMEPLLSESLVSNDRHATIIPLDINWDDRIDLIEDIIEEARSNSGFEVSVTGDATVDKDFNELSSHDLKSGELKIGLPIAVFVLILVFGALVAAFVPLLMAIVSIAVALGLAVLFAQGLTISVFLVNMVFTIGLAVGIDYCLFIIARYREERASGREKFEAIERAGATASQAVFFSGVTVFLALIALMLVPHDIFVSLGLGAVLVVLVSIAASLTLLPAVLGLLGDRVNGLRLSRLIWLLLLSGPRRRILPYRQWDSTSRAVMQAPFIGTLLSAISWDRISRGVMRVPIVSLLLGAGLLVAAAIPLFSIDIGHAGVGTFPDSFESKKGFIALEQDFSAGLTEPAVIVVDGDIGSSQVREGIDRLKDTLEGDSAFGNVTEEVNPEGDLAKLEVPVGGGDASSTVAIDAVNRLRGEYVPAAFAGIPARVLVTGFTAEVIDHVNIGNNGMRIVIPFVLVLSFLLLMLAFRSLVVPVKAVIMNLLSVGAAYGLLVLVFQKGWGAGFFGFQQVDTIEWWVPSFLFAVLFGLSMDYHVFLLSRIRERFFQTHDNTGSVAYGIRSTGRLITGAALIMVAVFAGFAAGDMVMFQQMGFGLAVAVLLDATIVRSVLVPASMKLLGERNWWLPSVLRWLPHIRAEGEVDT